LIGGSKTILEAVVRPFFPKGHFFRGACAVSSITSGSAEWGKLVGFIINERPRRKGGPYKSATLFACYISGVDWSSMKKDRLVPFFLRNEFVHEQPVWFT
jgi:hypothetical protein